jgi:hypothetical protein
VSSANLHTPLEHHALLPPYPQHCTIWAQGDIQHLRSRITVTEALALPTQEEHSWVRWELKTNPSAAEPDMRLYLKQRGHGSVGRTTGSVTRQNEPWVVTINGPRPRHRRKHLRSWQYGTKTTRLRSQLVWRITVWGRSDSRMCESTYSGGSIDAVVPDDVEMEFVTHSTFGGFRPDRGRVRAVCIVGHTRMKRCRSIRALGQGWYPRKPRTALDAYVEGQFGSCLMTSGM